MAQNQSTTNTTSQLHKNQFYFGLGAAVIFLTLTVLLYISFRADMQQSDWVAFYVLIGFIGGLVFYLVDPLRDQEFKWKGMVNIGGAAAVGATFMLLANELTPSSSKKLTMEDLFAPPYSTWIPIDKNSGKPEEVEVRPLGKSIPLPKTQPFKDLNLSLIEHKDVYLVALEDDPQIYFGRLEKGDFRRGKLSSRMEIRSDNLQIRRIPVNNVFNENFPFSIELYFEGDALRFKINDTDADSVLVDRAANKELNRILRINEKFYLVMVVLSLPDGSPPFAEFAIGELKLIF